MGVGELVLVAVNGVSTLLSNPLLSGGATVKAKHASELLAILGALVMRGAEAYEELNAFALMVKAMADEGRGPTREEREFLREQRALTHAGYQAEKARILGQQETATETALVDMTKAQLLEVAADREVAVSESWTKADIVEALEAAEGE